MAYNPFQWCTSHIKNKRLSSKAHLFDKIQNKDFDYSNYFNEAEVVRKRAAFTFENTMKETGTYTMARVASRMDNIRAMKLYETAHKHEFGLLKELRSELEKQFGFDLWDDMMKQPPMDLEELYDFYCHEKMRRRGLDI